MSSRSCFLDSGIKGFITPSDGSSIQAINKYVTIQVGSFSKTIMAKNLKKIKRNGDTVYVYEDWGCHGFAFEFVEGKGDFQLFIYNDDLEKDNSSLTADVTIGIDNYIAESMVTFKKVDLDRKKDRNQKKDHK